MTCIAAVTDGKTVWMGGDSAGSRNGILGTRAEAKVMRRGEFLLGYAGQARYGDILRYAFQPPEVQGELDAYMVRAFVPALRERSKDAGLATEDDDGCEYYMSRTLVGIRGQIYVIDTSLAVIKDAACYNAIGRGSEVALGALFATEGQEPKDRVMSALRAAERWTATVRAPFTIESA